MTRFPVQTQWLEMSFVAKIHRPTHGNTEVGDKRRKGQVRFSQCTGNDGRNEVTSVSCQFHLCVSDCAEMPTRPAVPLTSSPAELVDRGLDVD